MAEHEKESVSSCPAQSDHLGGQFANKFESMVVYFRGACICYY